jgi:hypothetical protein
MSEGPKSKRGIGSEKLARGIRLSVTNAELIDRVCDFNLRLQSLNNSFRNLQLPEYLGFIHDDGNYSLLT